MTTIAGASQYLNASTLANARGSSPSLPTLLGATSSSDLLDAGRRIYAGNGIGLSSNARALNKQFLNQTASGFNSLFSLSTAAIGSVETMQQQINAIRASIPESQLARGILEANASEENVLGENVDEEV